MKNFQGNNANYDEETKGTSYGKIALIAFGLVLMAVVILYALGAVKSNTPKEQQINSDIENGYTEVKPPEDSMTALDEALNEVKDPQSDKLQNQNNSDNVQDIENDLNNTDLGDVNVDNLGF